MEFAQADVRGTGIEVHQAVFPALDDLGRSRAAGHNLGIIFLAEQARNRMM
jgi:hypothetical protein